MDILKTSSPLIPFMTEKMYQNFKSEFKLNEESVHLLNWANVDEKSIDSKLESEIQLLQKLVSDILALREKIKRGLRWPIREIIVVTKSAKLKKAISSQKSLIKDFTNIVNIIATDKMPDGVSRELKPDYNKLAPQFKEKTTEVITKLHRSSHQKIFEQLDIEGFYAFTDETAEMIASGYAREFTRAIQSLRKKAGLQKRDIVPIKVFASTNLISMLQNYLPEIEKKVGAKSIEFTDKHLAENKKHSAEMKIRNERFLVGL